MTQRINRLNASGPSNLKFHPLLSTQFQNFNFKYEPNHLLYSTIIFSRFTIDLTALSSDITWPIPTRSERFVLIPDTLYLISCLLSVILVQSGLWYQSLCFALEYKIFVRAGVTWRLHAPPKSMRGGSYSRDFVWEKHDNSCLYYHGWIYLRLCRP